MQSEIPLMFFYLGNSTVFQKLEILLSALLSVLCCCLSLLGFFLALLSHFCVPGQTQDRRPDYLIFPVSPRSGRRLDGKSSAAVPLSPEKYV